VITWKRRESERGIPAGLRSSFSTDSGTAAPLRVRGGAQRRWRPPTLIGVSYERRSMQRTGTGKYNVYCSLFFAAIWKACLSQANTTSHTHTNWERHVIEKGRKMSLASYKEISKMKVWNKNGPSTRSLSLSFILFERAG